MLWLQALLGIGEIGAQIHQARINVKLAELNAKAALAQTKAQHTANWETAAVQQSESSWKDEWWTVLLSWPIIWTFVVHYNDVHAAFEQLDNMPAWYSWAVMASIAFSFGRKAIPATFGKGAAKITAGK